MLEMQPPPLSANPIFQGEKKTTKPNSPTAGLAHSSQARKSRTMARQRYRGRSPRRFAPKWFDFFFPAGLVKG